MRIENKERKRVSVIVSAMHSGSNFFGCLCSDAGWVRYEGEALLPLDDERGFVEAAESCEDQKSSTSEEIVHCFRVESPWLIPDQGRYLARRAERVYLLIRHPLAIWRYQKEIGLEICSLANLANQLQAMRLLLERTPSEKLQVLTFYELTSPVGRDSLFGKSSQTVTNQCSQAWDWKDPSSPDSSEKIRTVSVEEDVALALPGVWMDLEEEELVRAMAEFRTILKLAHLESLDVEFPEGILDQCKYLEIVKASSLNSAFVGNLIERKALLLSVQDCKRGKELPFADQVLKRVVSEDLVHCCSPDKLLNVLRELRRILEPGGVLRLSTIDFEWFSKLERDLIPEERDWYLGQIPLTKKEGLVETSDLIRDYLQKSEGHQYFYRRVTLKRLLERAGFEEVEEIKRTKNETSDRMPIDLYHKERFVLEARRNLSDLHNHGLSNRASFEVESLLQEVDRRKENNTIVLTVCDSNYTKIVENWEAHLKKLSVSNYLVIALDQALADQLVLQNVPHVLIPFKGNLNEFWRLKVTLVLNILSHGVGVIFSDADAVWLADPRDDLFNDSTVDLIISQGTTCPPEALELWGFTLCCGFFYAVPTPQAIELFGVLQAMNCSKFDDQRELNLEIMRRGITWEIREPEAIRSECGKELTGSKFPMLGNSETLKIKVLPFVSYQRPVIDTNIGKIIHPLSLKKQQATIKQLRKHGLWIKGHSDWDIKEKIAKQGFWFVDIPRTSSSSIRAELTREFGVINGKRGYLKKDMNHSVSQIISTHTPAAVMKERLGADLWDRIFTFSFVRNPYERIWSYYCYMLRVGHLREGEEFSGFVSSILKYGRRHPILRRSAFDMVTNKEGEIIVDQVCRFEDREKELYEIGNKLNMKFEGVFVQDVARFKSHYSNHYNKESKRIVEDLYPRDFELGEYPMSINGI